MDGIKKRKHNVCQSQINAPVATYTRRTSAKRQGNTKSDKTRNDGDTGATKVLTSLEEDAKRARAKGRRGEGRGVGCGVRLAVAPVATELLWTRMERHAGPFCKYCM